MSDYYNAGSTPGNGSFGSSSAMRAEFQAIESGISDKLPSLAGAASKVVIINPSGTGMTTVTLDKNSVGLGNVDNTSDLGKPLSTAAIAANDAQNTVIAGKATAGNVAPDIHAAAGKATPVAADEFGLADSAASFVLKRVTLAQLATALGVGAAPTITDITTGTNTITWDVAANPNAKATLNQNTTLNITGLGASAIGMKSLELTLSGGAWTVTYGANQVNPGRPTAYPADLGASGNVTLLTGLCNGTNLRYAYLPYLS